MNPLDDYYRNIINQYLPNKNQLLQKTPDQITQEQKIQAYQVYITTPEGISAVTELNNKFGEWFSTKYGVNKVDTSNDVTELKEIVLNIQKEMKSLTNQLK
jgi:hypothetical protein